MADIEKVKKGCEICEVTNCSECPYNKDENECMEGLFKDALAVIEQLEKKVEDQQERIDIMSEGGWIPVEKGLPNEDDPRGCLVVVHYDDPFVGEGDTVYSEIVGYSADSGDWVTIEGIALVDEVTHWQYAPEPPKEGEQQ